MVRVFLCGSSTLVCLLVAATIAHAQQPAPSQQPAPQGQMNMEHGAGQMQNAQPQGYAPGGQQGGMGMGGMGMDGMMDMHKMMHGGGNNAPAATPAPAQQGPQPPAAAHAPAQTGQAPATAPQCPPGTTMQMDSAGQHSCK
jgi:hypothetical protein